MESQTITSQAPWLNKKGQPISDSQLKIISRSWDRDTWEKYLSSLETPGKEILIRPRNYKRLRERNHIYENFPGFSITSGKLKNALHRLTKKQQKIIFLFFFEGLSHRKIALRMNISHSCVLKMKHRALKSLKKLI